MPEVTFGGGTGCLFGVDAGDLDAPGVVLPESVEDQTRRIFVNLDALLARHALGREHLLGVRIHITQFERFHRRVERTLTVVFAERSRVSTSCIGVTALPRDALIAADFVLRAGSHAQ